ncbi:MAG TPA: hypothetical protein VMN60_12240 [Longimicrobiales bacterium]|nr:hypothetical protein [Longimicrobiales bacterium]
MAWFAKRRSSTQPVTRLTFEYQGPEIRLVKRQDVEMRLPPSAPVEDFSGRTGYWYSLRDERGNSLYGHVLGQPLAGREVFRRTATESIARVNDTQPKGWFTVLVPTPTATAQLVIYGPPAGTAPSANRGSVEIGSFAVTPTERKR